MTHELLVELGTQELPPRQLRTLAQAFADNFANELTAAKLGYDELKWFATPRRLAIKVFNLSSCQADTVIEKKGPALSSAFDANGVLTSAAQGWLKSCGITFEQSARLQTDKGEWLLFKQVLAGKDAAYVIPSLVSKALDELPITKPMKWGDKDTQFIRPVNNLTIILDDQLVSANVLGINSDRTLLGHRFMGEQSFTIDFAREYPDILLSKGKVVADYEQRKEFIIAEIKKAADNVGGIADLDDELVEEVTSLVEWPVILVARFEDRFLQVPQEALVHTMKGDQKYFPVYKVGATSPDKELLPYFVFVSNIDSPEPHHIISGNEKVIRPRLADAQFFFNTDRKQALVDYLPKLSHVIFQKQLGTLRDKTNRIIELSSYIAQKIKVDKIKTQRAALLAKCDLMTSMVFEFTDTQGIMGMHYARHDGEDPAVALALSEQYLPRFAGDILPSQGISSALAIADKLDTIVGIFGVGQAPQGSDPFALRRAALGILRIIVQNQYPLDLIDIIAKAQSLFINDDSGNILTNKNVVQDVLEFMLGRIPAWYQDEGISLDTIQAVLACKPTKPIDFDKRVKAVAYFRNLEEAQALAAANKRVSNILAKNNVALENHIDLTLLKEEAEITLANLVIKLESDLAVDFATGNYQSALTSLANLQQPVDHFFENVMVMNDNEALQNNRLIMLARLQQLFLQVADISVLQK